MKKPKHDPTALSLTTTASETVEQAKARAALQPSINAAAVIESFQTNVLGKDISLTEVVTTLNSTFKEVNSGDLSSLEAMLISQATALQSMFTSLARRASNQENIKHYEVFASLALKAQAQSRATISALVDLKYPRQATFIRQANVAHGPQQVNNGPADALAAPKDHAHAKEIKPAQPELLEATNGSTSMDRRAEAATARSHPAMEAVGAVNGTANRRRKSQGGTQR